MTNYCSNHCESNSTLFITTPQETQICQRFDEGKCSGRLWVIWRLHAVIYAGPISWTFLSYFFSNISFKICDTLLYFLKNHLFIFQPAMSFIWEAFKFVKARTWHFSPSLYSLALFLGETFRPVILSIHITFFSSMDDSSWIFMRPLCFVIRFVFSSERTNTLAVATLALNSC